MDNSSGSLVQRKRSGFGKVFTVIILFLLLGGGTYFYWKYYFTYSSGNRYGLLQKFSHKGNLFKTYEGEMVLSSIRSNANVSLASEKFFFSVTKKNVADELMNAQGKFVTVHYKQKNGTLSWRGDTEYIVDSVQVDK
jgi:hypothetical protein